MARTDLIKIIPKLGIFSFIVHIFGTLINTRVVGEGRFCSSRGDYCPFARFFYARSFKIFNYSILAFYHCSTSSFNVVKVKKLNYKFIRERENVRLFQLELYIGFFFFYSRGTCFNNFSRPRIFHGLCFR